MRGARRAEERPTTARPASRRRAVVVGVDGSSSSAEAVRWAAAEADRRSAPLRLVTAFPWPADLVSGTRPSHRHRNAMLADSRADLDDAAALALAARPDLRINRRMTIGHPVPVLEAEARSARLLVLGSRGLGGIAGLVVGSVSVALSARAACPVVVVRRDADGPPDRPVVVGVDGAAAGEAALGFAFDAAARRGAPLVAVHGCPGTGPVGPFTARAADRHGPDDERRDVLDAALAPWTGRFPGVPVRRVVVADRPAHALVEWSGAAQLVVVGSRGRGDLGGLLLGSVGHAVLHHSGCPVVVVRPGTTEV